MSLGGQTFELPSIHLKTPRLVFRFSYVLNNPLLLTDPDGREPNKSQAATIQQIVAIVEQTERDNPNLGPREILQRVDGFFRNQTEGPGDWRYVYTEEKGWIDFKHFFAAANQAASVGEAVTDALGVGMELFQTVTGSTSAFSYEDLPSNATGADFGDDVFDPNGAPLSQQVASYVNGLRPTVPTAAPNYGSVPDAPDYGSRLNQSGSSRTMDSSTASTRQGAQGSSGPRPANAPRSSGAPQAPKPATSSGNRKRPEDRQ